MKEKSLETGQSWHLRETFLWEVHYANWEGNYIMFVPIRLVLAMRSREKEIPERKR
jgi:hypothetical protein